MLLELFIETELLHYFYLFLSLLGLFIIVTRRKMKVEDELRNPVQISNHPEQKSQKSKYLRLIILQFTISILMALTTVAGVFRFAFDNTSPAGKVVIQQYMDSIEKD